MNVAALNEIKVRRVKFMLTFRYRGEGEEEEEEEETKRKEEKKRGLKENKLGSSLRVNG
jgi:hypothetical protein